MKNRNCDLWTCGDYKQAPHGQGAAYGAGTRSCLNLGELTTARGRGIALKFLGALLFIALIISGGCRHSEPPKAVKSYGTSFSLLKTYTTHLNKGESLGSDAWSYVVKGLRGDSVEAGNAAMLLVLATEKRAATYDCAVGLVQDAIVSNRNSVSLLVLPLCVCLKLPVGTAMTREVAKYRERSQAAGGFNAELKEFIEESVVSPRIETRISAAILIGDISGVREADVSFAERAVNLGLKHAPSGSEQRLWTLLKERLLLF